LHINLGILTNVIATYIHFYAQPGLNLHKAEPQPVIFAKEPFSHKLSHTISTKAMADIDDELLALAGEASSDEEEDAPMNISRESSASPDRKTSGKPSAKKSGGKKASRRQNDSEEEGEA
jgi:hypothetical protein